MDWVTNYSVYLAIFLSAVQVIFGGYIAGSNKVKLKVKVFYSVLLILYGILVFVLLFELKFWLCFFMFVVLYLTLYLVWRPNKQSEI
ncbi:hypothetical protein PsB1_0982 [Candidatus Phycosocius spiralis]|uniref:Uncharacterized protein n=1 Tax=Candidatus Phycosocius spiralis TaxID=2815099 RepID=A0ABQ4PVY3_9PROT|nr:hypothetical protein PsB1_0982 [Candidatus Phycosocius spiralis]